MAAGGLGVVAGGAGRGETVGAGEAEAPDGVPAGGCVGAADTADEGRAAGDAPGADAPGAGTPGETAAGGWTLGGGVASTGDTTVIGALPPGAPGPGDAVGAPGAAGAPGCAAALGVM